MVYHPDKMYSQYVGMVTNKKGAEKKTETGLYGIKMITMHSGNQLQRSREIEGEDHTQYFSGPAAERRKWEYCSIDSINYDLS